MTSKSPSSSSSITYRDAGVDIDAGEALIDRIKPLARATKTLHGSANLGGFGAAFAIDTVRWPQPVLISGTDGVGTKLKIAIETNRHDTIGIDLVAMCANDILVTGATPLFFLDYYATGKLDVDAAEAVIKGIAQGCQQAQMTLSGGETAEMPGMYEDGHYDLAGFAVGIVNADAMIDGSTIEPGHVVIGVESSGVHSNGYSLVRKVMEHAGKRWEDPFDNATFADTFLKPTKLYCVAVTSLIETTRIHGMAHITGGGIPDNLPRVLPHGTKAIIDRSSWEMPNEFKWLKDNGNIETSEMDRAFNCGIGFILIVDHDEADSVIKHFAQHSTKASIIGTIDSNDAAPYVEYLP